MADEEEIIMTPTKKGKTTHIRIERKKKLDMNGAEVEKRHYVAGGEHKGLVVNKSSQGDDEENLGKPQVQLAFNCFMVDVKTKKNAVESRKLKFWFVDEAGYLDQMATAFEFFKVLLKPENFPKDYVGFIKKCMKQMQNSRYNLIRKLNMEIQVLGDDEVPMTPEQNQDVAFGKVKDPRPIHEIVREKLLSILESAYPNILTVEDLLRILKSDEATAEADDSLVHAQLQELQDRELVKRLENGSFVRHVRDEKGGHTEVQVVKQMNQVVTKNNQPTIAIITANYCEKVAVDAMMENKTTYVKYKTGGESNAYTIGFIGSHRCVSTKLPMIGHDRSAMIAAGNTTTRLLGVFQAVEHVFVVGVGGGVPHFTDYHKHPRLGDVLISQCDSQGNIYYYCNGLYQEKDQSLHYKTKSFKPKDKSLQEVVRRIQETRERRAFSPWEKYITQGLEALSVQEADYNRPAAATDRLTLTIGEGNVIEMQHPQHPEGLDERQGWPKILYGAIGAGAKFAHDDDLRMDYAARNNLQCFDCQFDQVLEGIVGSVKESFMFIRGISDYSDGMQKKEWQPYSALAAAAVMKTIIKSFDGPYISEDEL
ncbi:uncharacterized protein LOC127859952 isoform X2 [Dreissena polymorpha]|uniref:uncharacterized protein LOC127859952 isoform X2 n=1 Tax=Dreissena polymorpha TaxID=45954 RepID=UPI002264E97D|nr:uncharacterized protein LOC127859952 isoform X2 [Dreissena polymorpha]